MELAWEGARDLRVVRKVEECRDTCSLYLDPLEGGSLPPFQPGQYLTFELELPGEPRPLVRCYSLSNAPGAGPYRVTVKRVPPPPGSTHPPGRGSSHLVERVQPGEVLRVRAPLGSFSSDPRQRHPLVLIGAGIGLTPLLGMLEAQVRGGVAREVWLFLGFRCGAEHPFRARLQELAANHPGIHLRVAYSRPEAEDREGRDYDRRGRVDLAWIRESLPPADEPYAFYLCGPPAMLATLPGELEGLGVPASAIHLEAFGAPTVRPLTRRLARGGLSGEPPRVRFATSNQEERWDPEAGSILDFAMSKGVFIPFACAAGHCGTCSTRLLAGQVRYPFDPQYPLREGMCLPCVAVPAGPVELEM